MGYITYAGSQEYEFEDRTLSHLKMAIAMKLRRQESFLLNWSNSPQTGSGRMSIWLAPSIPLSFRFSGSRTPELNESWVSVLHELSNTPRGMVVITEEEAERYLANK
ncbi:hypothetical protein [uncultured Agrococcus sp.]|uniref:DUF7882 family protein n=1 Tax=uncultured Agrococcus sp. TaxID=382258 RepID=UPI0025DFED69|nr:hypothetical protein [uncultured Agrococcus sp.]